MMNIEITGQHMKVTDGLREAVEEKFAKLERHLQAITQVHVVMHVDKTQHKAEATLNHRGGQIRASASSGDMYVTIQDLYEKLERQAIKFKEKLHDHGRGHEENEE
jgi:putative sigma-54 modulation protein